MLAEPALISSNDPESRTDLSAHVDVGAPMAVPMPSDWNVRSIEVALLEPHVTTQSADVTALDPGCTTPNSVTFAVPGAQPLVTTVVALGIVAVTMIADDAPLETPTPSAIAASAPHASARVRTRACALRVREGGRRDILDGIGTTRPNDEIFATIGVANGPVRDWR